MAHGIEAITTQALGLALDAASLRQQVIAANIANAETPGYQPLAVNFEAQLGDAKRALDSEGGLDAAALDSVKPRLEISDETSPAGLTPGVSLDLEVAHLSQNAVRYETLLKGLSKHFAMLSTAIGDGQR